jgi:hypothetical protein
VGEGLELIDAVRSDEILAPYADALERYARASIRLHPDRSAVRYLGETKVGGKPAVPPDFAWPTRHVEMPDPSPAWIERQYFAPRLLPPDRQSAFSFIAQVDLAAVSRFDTEQVLPSDGLLLFFYDEFYSADVDPEVIRSSGTASYGDDRVFHTSEFGFDQVDQVRVVHVPARIPLMLSAAGSTARYAMPLVASADRTLPTVDEYCIAPESAPPEDRGDRVVLPPDAWERLAGLEYDIRLNAHIDQMLGWADNGAHGGSLPPEHARGLASVPLADRLPESQDPRLLLQLDPTTYEPVGIEFGRTLYFYARESDLRRGDFSRCWYDSD